MSISLIIPKFIRGSISQSNSFSSIIVALLKFTRSSIDCQIDI